MKGLKLNDCKYTWNLSRTLRTLSVEQIFSCGAIFLHKKICACFVQEKCSAQKAILPTWNFFIDMLSKIAPSNKQFCSPLSLWMCDKFLIGLFWTAMPDHKAPLATKLLLLGQYLRFNQNMHFLKSTLCSTFLQVFCSASVAPPQCRGTSTTSWTSPSGRCHRLTSSRLCSLIIFTRIIRFLWLSVGLSVHIKTIWHQFKLCGNHLVNMLGLVCGNFGGQGWSHPIPSLFLKSACKCAQAWQPSLMNPSTHLPLLTQDEESELEPK